VNGLTGALIGHEREHVDGAGRWRDNWCGSVRTGGYHEGQYEELTSTPHSVEWCSDHEERTGSRVRMAHVDQMHRLKADKLTDRVRIAQERAWKSF
jgi:hypothetical protein